MTDSKSTYLVLVEIPYEGALTEILPSLEEVASWIRAHGYSLDDVEIYEVVGSVDIYDLMKRTAP